MPTCKTSLVWHTNLCLSMYLY